MTEPETLILTRPDDIAAVTAPARQEIIAALGEGEGARTAAELSERLGRSRHSLYYHLRILVGAGVVRRQEPEGGGAGGARFSLAARRIAVGAHPDDAAAIRGGVKAARAILAITERELVDAIRSGEARRKGGAREVIALRGKARLDAEGLRELDALVGRLEAVLGSLHREEGEGRMYALTIALTPAREPSGADEAGDGETG